MPYVTVTSPLRRKIYLNGIYDEPAGTIPTTFDVEPGSHRFETLCQDGSVDCRSTVRVKRNDDLSIALTKIKDCVRQQAGE
jgi:hypothetical protein